MNVDELRAAQAPLKARYRTEPEAALVTQTAMGTLDASVQVCHVETHLGSVEAGLEGRRMLRWPRKLLTVVAVSSERPPVSPASRKVPSSHV
jgi:hypothetical protein